MTAPLHRSLGSRIQGSGRCPSHEGIFPPSYPAELAILRKSEVIIEIDDCD